MNTHLTKLSADVEPWERFCLQMGRDYFRMEENFKPYWSIWLGKTRTFEEWCNNVHLATPEWYINDKEHTLHNLSEELDEEGKPIELFKLTPVVPIKREGKLHRVRRVSEYPLRYHCFTCGIDMDQVQFSNHKNAHIIKYIKLTSPKYATIRIM